MRTEKLGSATLENWSPAEVKAALDRHEITLIDVRTPEEYVHGHIEGALLAPMQSVGPLDLPMAGGKPAVLHCGSGKRSAMVAMACAEAGFTGLAHMEGGFMAWRAAGLPYVALDPSTGAPRRTTDR